MNFLTNINLNGNRLEGAIIDNAIIQNTIIQNVGVNPSPLREGQIWYNSTTHQLMYAALVEGEIKAVIIGEGEISQEEFDALNTALSNRIAALETSIGGEESGLIADVASANTKADNAAANASEAKTTAATAASDASTAKSDAANAVSTANNASSTAAAATATASAAQTTANEAKTESATALAKAASAESVAGEAKTAAENAQTAANTAQAAAQAAQESANLKVEKVNGAENNIVIFGTDNAIQDSGKTIQDVIDAAIEAGAGEGEEINLSNYIQKVSEPVEGNLITLTSEGGIANSGYSINASINSESPSDKEIPTADAIAAYVNTKIESVASGINYKGVLSSTNTITTPYKQGDMYYVGERITIFDHQCDVGDILIAIGEKIQGAESSAEDWSFLEGNRDVFKGATTESTGVPGLVPKADPLKEGESLYLRSDGTWNIPIADRYIEYNSLLYPQSGQVVWDINHKLNKSAVQVIIYQVNDKLNEQYTQVMCDIEIYGKNDCTIKFNSDAASIAADSYMAVIM